MFFRIIAQIQQRPLESRRRITFWVALLLTCLIALAWLLTVLVSSPVPAKATAGTPGPLQALLSGLGEGFDAIKDTVTF